MSLPQWAFPGDFGLGSRQFHIEIVMLQAHCAPPDRLHSNLSDIHSRSKILQIRLCSRQPQQSNTKIQSRQSRECTLKITFPASFFMLLVHTSPHQESLWRRYFRRRVCWKWVTGVEVPVCTLASRNLGINYQGVRNKTPPYNKWPPPKILGFGEK